MTLHSFSYFFFCLAQIDTTHFVLVIRPFVRDIQQNSNGVPVETGANMALLWGELYWMDNVTDHCLEREGGVGGCEVLWWWESEKETVIGGNERVQECGTAGSNHRREECGASVPYTHI